MARWKRWQRPVLWCSGGLLLLLIALLVTGVVLARRVEPMLRARLLRTFAERFESPVRVGGLQVHYDGMFQVDARDLEVQTVVRGVPGDATRPMLQVGEFHFRVGLLTALSASPRIHHVRIRGVQLYLPGSASTPSHAPDPEHEVDLEYAEVDDAHIHFAAAEGRAPLVFDLPHIVLRGVSRSKPVRFHAVVDNGPPIGITETDGTIGPWNFNDPRLVPVKGTFTFKDKDVSSVRGLRGRLNLIGSYTGTVGRLHAEGTTDDPAFGLDVSSRTVPLHTAFVLTLAAEHGAVEIERLQGSFLHTTFAVRGEATKERASERWALDTELQSDTARAEDTLALAAHTPEPVLRGAMAVHGRLRMRAAGESVSRRLSLTGAAFQITGARFSNTAVQQNANDLASRARGEVKAAKDGTADPVTAELLGPVTLENAVLRFPALRVSVPGADAALHGMYSLDGTQFHFEGTVHTEVGVSHMTGGVKSVLLKPFNGLFRKGGRGGATLPLYVNGVGNAPRFTTRVAGLKMEAPGD